MEAKDIMKKEVITVTKNTTVHDVAKILFKNRISGAPVVDQEQRVIGVVSEQDLIIQEKEPRFPSYIEILGSIIFVDGARQYNEELKKLASFTAGQIMTTQVYTIGPDTPLEDIANMMVEKRVNRIPVVDEEQKLIGIVSRADLLKGLISE